jgi:hypothetical protein
MDNLNSGNEITFNILQYVKENLFGLFLLIFTFFIIYFVDYINKLNALFYSSPSPIIGISSTINAKKSVKRKSKSSNFI